MNLFKFGGRNANYLMETDFCPHPALPHRAWGHIAFGADPVSESVDARVGVGVGLIGSCAISLIN